jgi:hypothetical protein
MVARIVTNVAPRLVFADLHDAGYQLLKDGDAGQSEITGRALVRSCWKNDRPCGDELGPSPGCEG